MKAGMYRSGWIIAVASALMSMPTVCYATTAEDPGAFAALGTIYFSSVLDDSGIGFGHAANPSMAGAINHGFAGNRTHRSNTGNTTTTSGGSDPSTPIVGDIGPGNSPGGSGTGLDGGSDETSTHFPDGNTADPPGGGGVTYVPDEILTGPWPDTDQNGPLIPEITVASSPRILQVPEPASLALFGVGLAGLSWMSRRRKT